MRQSLVKLNQRVLMGAVLLFGSLIMFQPVYAETYIAGQVGYTMPNDLSDIDVKDPAFPAGSTLSDLDLKNSLMYGLKVGHYFNSLRWLGLEVEAFNTNPHIKQQSQTLTAPGLGSATTDVPGLTGRVTTVAFNLLARYPGERLQPYAGAGLGLFFARFHSAAVNESQSDNARPGLNVLAGLRYLVTKNVALFGEYKYNYVRFNFDPTQNLLGADATYSAHHFVFGVGYHFN